MQKKLRVGGLYLAVLVALCALPMSRRSLAGSYTAITEYAVRFIQVSSTNLPKNCVGNDCVYVSTVDGKLYHRTPAGASVGLEATTAATFDVLRYGAQCDGVTDDSIALQSAFTAAAAATSSNGKGGVVLLPKGQCNFGTPLAAQSSRGLTIQGQGGRAPGNPKPASTLLYTGTGSASAVQVNASQAITFRDLGLLYSSSSFTGILLDFSQSAQSFSGAYISVDNCLIGGSFSDNTGAFTAANLVSLDRTFDVDIQRTNFQGAVVGIHLRDSSGSFANSIKIYGNCRFSDFQVGAITNGSQQLVIRDSTFENNPDIIAYNTAHSTSFATMAPAYTTESSMATQGFEFSGNYMGDGDGSKPVFDTTSNQVQGLTFTGNFVAGNITLGTTAGAAITGNSFNTVTMTFNGASYGGVVVGWDGTPGALTLSGTPSTGVSFVGIRNIGGTNNIADNFQVNKISTDTGDLILAPVSGNILPPSDSSGTIGSVSLRYQNGFFKTISAGSAGLTLTGGSTSWVLNASGLDIGAAATAPLCAINATKCTLAKSTTETQVLGGFALHTTAVNDTAYTALVGDAIIAYTALTAGRTVTIPTAAAGNAGQTYVVKNQSAGAFAITISPATGTVDAAASVATTAAGRAPAVRVYSDGAAWYTF